MPDIWNALKNAARIEGLGGLTIDQVRVFLYLGTHKRRERPSLPEVAEELGIVENTVASAFKELAREGFIVLTGKNQPERDANSYELTPKAKKALGQLLNTIGYVDASFIGALTFALGVLVGGMYLSYQVYPAYFGFILLLTVVASGVLILFLVNTVRASRSRRRQVLSVMLRKPEQGW